MPKIVNCFLAIKRVYINSFFIFAILQQDETEKPGEMSSNFASITINDMESDASPKKLSKAQKRRVLILNVLPFYVAALLCMYPFHFLLMFDCYTCCQI